MTVALGVVFATWFAIAAVNQFRGGAWTMRLRRHIPFGVIPLWTFFAPNPARADARLIWRVEIDGAWAPWREVHFGFGPFGSRWLVHPQLIPNKAVSDLSNALARSDRARVGDRAILLSSSYVALLSMVAGQPRPEGCAALQFALVRTAMVDGHERDVTVAFVSEVHDVSDPRHEPVSHVR